ncbi:MAG: hypothetical protein ACUVQ0_02390 [Thermoproteota archaeon]
MKPNRRAQRIWDYDDREVIVLKGSKQPELIDDDGKVFKLPSWKSWKVSSCSYRVKKVVIKRVREYRIDRKTIVRVTTKEIYPNSTEKPKVFRIIRFKNDSE